MSDEINLVVFVNWLVISLHKYKLIRIVLVEFSIYLHVWFRTFFLLAMHK